MKVNGQHFHSIWRKPEDPSSVFIIDQRYLPHEFRIERLQTLAEVARAIKEMHVRGAPLIGATAAYGMYLAAFNEPSRVVVREYYRQAADQLKATRPTAINLNWAVDQMLQKLLPAADKNQRLEKALALADQIAEEDVVNCKNIGASGLPLLQELSRNKRSGPLNILTHCNAGWLACVDYGTATSPIYQAHDAGIPLHIWVDETRPRNQGARLTAWELGQHGVPHTVIADNAGGHLMQHGLVDIVIVGSDRTTREGDVANKIGTYLKALAARDNNIPFYVALPASSFDWKIRNGLKEIPIEKRESEEVTHIQGLSEGVLRQVQLTPSGSPAVNYGFDVTPAHLVTGLITERGICAAREERILEMFPEHR